MKAGSRAITVGQAARRTGLSPKAIRLYESRGLLPSAQRTLAGYRTYSEGDVALLRFVRQAKALGLSLDEIKKVVDLQRGGSQPCGTVIRLLDGHLREIDEMVKQLRALKKTLLRAREAASTSERNGQEAIVCRIIESAPLSYQITIPL